MWDLMTGCATSARSHGGMGLYAYAFMGSSTPSVGGPPG